MEKSRNRDQRARASLSPAGMGKIRRGGQLEVGSFVAVIGRLGLTVFHLFEERSGFVVNRRISLGLLVDPDIYL